MKCDCPLVSIVVPAYNHEEFIEECLESIVNQDYPNLQIIVINDGSTDKTGDKIEGFIRRYGEVANLRYINKKNEGLIKTLNLGLRLAKGKYFCQIASDDMLLPGSITKRAYFMENNSHFDAVFADAFIVRMYEKTNERIFGKLKNPYESARHTIRDLLTKKARLHFPTGMFKRDFFIGIGGFDEGFRYDESYYIRYLVCLYANVGYLDEPVMYYRYHGRNVSRGNPLRRIPEKMLALKKLSFLVKDNSLKRLVNKMLFTYHINYFRRHLESGAQQQELLKILYEAAALCHWSPRLLYCRLRLIATMRLGVRS